LQKQTAPGLQNAPSSFTGDDPFFVFVLFSFFVLLLRAKQLRGHINDTEHRSNDEQFAGKNFPRSTQRLILSGG
jgi:hypothetical protein